MRSGVQFSLSLQRSSPNPALPDFLFGLRQSHAFRMSDDGDTIKRTPAGSLWGFLCKAPPKESRSNSPSRYKENQTLTRLIGWVVFLFSHHLHTTGLYIASQRNKLPVFLILFLSSVIEVILFGYLVDKSSSTHFN